MWRSTAATSGECILKKLANLGFGRRAKIAQQTLVIRGLRQDFKLDILLEAAHLARTTHYYHEKRLATAAKYHDAKEVIAAIYQEDKGRYGYRRITLALHQWGRAVSHKTVHWICTAVRLSATQFM
ncbi:MAG: IS3 family transposase, partial [Oscillospiraceae bacterium]